MNPDKRTPLNALGLAAVLSTVALAGCIDGFDVAPTASALALYVDTSLPEDAEKLYLTYDQVAVSQAEPAIGNAAQAMALQDDSTSWTDIDADPQTVEVDANASGEVFLGDTSLAPGQYGDLRIRLLEATLVLKNGHEVDLKVPYQAIRMARAFELHSGLETRLALDFPIEDDGADRRITQLRVVQERTVTLPDGTVIEDRREMHARRVMVDYPERDRPGWARAGLVVSDTPTDAYEHFYVTITGAGIRHDGPEDADHGFIRLFQGEMTIDIGSDADGAHEIVAIKRVPEGYYGALAVTVSEAWAIDANGNNVTFEVADGPLLARGYQRVVNGQLTMGNVVFGLNTTQSNVTDAPVFDPQLDVTVHRFEPGHRHGDWRHDDRDIPRWGALVMAAHDDPDGPLASFQMEVTKVEVLLKRPHAIRDNGTDANASARDGRWITLFEGRQVFDLADASDGLWAYLGSHRMPYGIYTQVRVTGEVVHAETKDGTVLDVQTRSDSVLVRRPFAVLPGQVAIVVPYIDLEESLKRGDNGTVWLTNHIRLRVHHLQPVQADDGVDDPAPRPLPAEQHEVMRPDDRR